MSQVPRPQKSENDNDRLPVTRENHNKSRYEGFEGMNFEQHRQPFQDHPAGNSGKNKSPLEEAKAPKKD